jgi:hypothetical protein
MSGCHVAASFPGRGRALSFLRREHVLDWVGSVPSLEGQSMRSPRRHYSPGGLQERAPGSRGARALLVIRSDLTGAAPSLPGRLNKRHCRLRRVLTQDRL